VTIKVEVEVYGELAELDEFKKGTRSMVLSEHSTLEDLLDELNLKYKLNFYTFIINGQKENLRENLKDGDKVKIIPVLGGG